MALNHDEVAAKLVLLESDIAAMRRAFVKNDLQEPDYDGHRKAHKAEIDADGNMQELKHAATKQILQWMIGALLLAISGLSMFKTFFGGA